MTRLRVLVLLATQASVVTAAGARGRLVRAGRGRGVSAHGGGGRGRMPMHGRANSTSSLFGGVPLFMVEEKVPKLMRHAPPYGYNLRGFLERKLLAFRRNGTVPEQTRFDSCAVVGSSGTLLQQSLGAEIDAHDAVLRVNGAPLPPKLRAHTGSRTTWRVLSSPHAASDFRFKEQEQYPDTPLVVVCDRPFVYSCQNVMFGTRKPLMHGVSPIFYAAVRRHADKRKRAIPLTGVVAVAMAIRSCARVDVYGMSTMSAEARRTCFYYWSCGQGTDARYHSRPGDAEFHDFRGNALALLRWNASGHIRIRV